MYRCNTGLMEPGVLRYTGVQEQYRVSEVQE